jgi:hypothetical protein
MARATHSRKDTTKPIKGGSILVIVDQPPTAHGKQFVGSGLLGSRAQALDVSIEKLQANLKRTLEKLSNVFDVLPSSGKSFTLNQIKVSLIIRADGTIGLLSAVGGSVSASTAIEVTLSPKQPAGRDV